ncbi:MAG: SbcC/MukB-like Walker B domain-containing protein [Bacteroidales bacterium]|nr:SbcC/MukB-like Walker B domain-containing protein [Bacteroidales bacterium]MDY5788351.1 SbcC/MukB-like Walker B domain-containing protein [Candidatus Onthomorpha sp.]
MKPIKLSIEGVFSYRTRQEIDFTKLSSEGIFGIFGNTGSGKSSIVEAIIFALYGKIERVSGKQIDLINLQSNKAVIDFEFEVSGKAYRVVVNLTRTSSGHSTKKLFYQKQEGQYRAMEEKISGEQLTGLSYDNFCRVVIIPQGKFQDFLTLTSGERTKMLKEIFPSLKKYDLSNTLRAMREETEGMQKEKMGQLNSYSEYTIEALNERKEQYAVVEQQYKDLEILIKNLKEDLDSRKTLFDAFKKQEELSQNFDRLKLNEENISALKDRLDQYRKTNRVFGSLLTKYDDLLLRKKRTSDLFSELSLQVADLEKKKQSLEEELAALQKENEQTPLQQQEADNLKTLADLRELESEMAILDKKMKDEQKRLENGKACVAAEENKKQNKEKEIADKESRLLNAEEFRSVRDWFAKNQRLNEDLARLEKENQDLCKKKTDCLSPFGDISPDNPEAELQQRLQDTEEQISKAENLLSDYNVKQALCQYSKALSSNEPCPLCGSLSHPHPAELADVDEHLKQIKSTIRDLKARKETLEKAVASLDFYSKQIQSKQEQINSLQQDIETHKRQFVWANYLGKSSLEITQMENEDIRLQNELKELRSALAAIDRNIRKYSEALKQIENSVEQSRNALTKHQGRKEELGKNLSEEFVLQYAQVDVNQLNEQRQKLLAVLEKRNAVLAERNAVLSKQNAVLFKREGERNSCKQNLETIIGETDKCESEIERQIACGGFQSLESVRQILSSSFDEDDAQTQIDNFNRQMIEFSSQLAALSEQTSGKDRPAEENIKSDEQTLSQKEKEFKSCIANKGGIEKEINLFETKLSQKTELEKEMKKAEARLDALNKLSQMFKGDKFIQFISTVYLEQLCAKANERLQIITNNKFAIRYWEENFEVIDNLNSGKTRSLKTLSGGQIFQASLCMALALVDTIRLNSDTREDFFFLDEGFGTQDNESIELIFKSLVSLRQENKIVGLISHSEILKEKISYNIAVRLDQNEGSLIENNY